MDAENDWNRWSVADLLATMLCLAVGLGVAQGTTQWPGMAARGSDAALLGWLTGATSWMILAVGVQFWRGRTEPPSIGEWLGVAPGLAAGTIGLMHQFPMVVGRIWIYLFLSELALLVAGLAASVALLSLHMSGERSVANARTDIIGCLILFISIAWLVGATFGGW